MSLGASGAECSEEVVFGGARAGRWIRADRLGNPTNGFAAEHRAGRTDHRPNFGLIVLRTLGLMLGPFLVNTNKQY